MAGLSRGVSALVLVFCISASSEVAQAGQHARTEVDVKVTIDTDSGDSGAFGSSPKPVCQRIDFGSPSLAMTNQNFDLSSPNGGSQLAVVTADFNCDGKQDFATVDVGGQYGGFVYVHVQQEHGVFSLSANLTGLSPGPPQDPGDPGLEDAQRFMNLGNLAAADVNGDGIADLITVGTDYDDVPNQILLVWLGNGDGTFPEAPSQSWFVTSENADPAPGLAVADFNDDGALDIAVSDPKIWYFGADNAGNPRGPGNVIIFLGDASLGQFSEDPLPPIEVGNAPFDIKVCNFNADGSPDLLVTNYFSNTTTVILTSPAMPTHLWEKHSYPVDGFPMFSACGAFAGKEVDDFATSITPWSQQASPPVEASLSVLGGSADTPASGTLDVWYNDGSGNFKDSRQFPAGQGYGLQLATGDVDGDDILDLVVASTNGDIQILQGSADGSFEAAASLHQPDEQRAYGVALTDFNGDGLLDIVTANTPPLITGDFFFAPRGGANVLINTCWVDESPAH